MTGRRGAAARCLLVLLALFAAGCATSPAPVMERGVSDIPASGHHRVRKGDTLYSIAWRYGVDWEQLARRNGLAAPYTIQIGQRIRIVGPTVAAAPSAAPASRPSKPARTAPRSETAPAASRPAPATPARAEAAAAGPLRWDWPLEGEVVRGFELRGDAVNKGLDIRGASGATVRTAARGQVVYAGTGLRGHSRLVIVKHDDRWLSAYAHDDEILVREGQVLAAGAQVARLAGGTGGSRTLHFEIRREGKPVDPAALLPRR